MRVVSVLPSATEIVFALGHGSELVARSEECDYPPEAVRLPVVMRAKARDADRPSREIDTRVRAVRGQGESLYSLDVDLLQRLRPDVLLTQDLCSVCSVTDEEVRVACGKAGVAPRIVSLSPRTLSEVWESVRAVGEALNDPRAGRELADRLRSRSRGSAAAPDRPRVAVIEWVDPPILAGLWTPDIVRAAGGEPVGPEPGAAGHRTRWEDLARERLDLAIVSPCSFSVPRTLRELEEPGVRRGVGRLRPRLGLHVADEAYFSRPGPRLADGVDLVRDLLAGGPGAGPMPVTALPTTAGGSPA